MKMDASIEDFAPATASRSTPVEGALEPSAAFTPGPWKAHLNVPNAVMEGHIVKKDDDIQRPICSLCRSPTPA